MKDEELMRMLMQAASMAKRQPHREITDDNNAPSYKRGRGYGHILSALNENNGQSQQDLADNIGIRAQSLSEALSALEEKGYVIRKTCDGDKRKILVYITESGRERGKTLAAERAERAKTLFASLAPSEKATLSAILSKIMTEKPTDYTDTIL